MKSKVILIMILGLVLVGGLWLTVSNISRANYSKFEKNLILEKQKAPPTVETTLTEGTILDTSYKHEELLEIELTSEDIYTADTTGIIGVNEPFNNEFITRVDVINSINRIGEGVLEFEQIDSSFQNEFLTLRHVEMVEGVREVNSSLKPALQEYAEKILGKTQQEDVTQLNGNTLSSDSDLIYRADVSNAETETLLSGR